MYIILYHDKRDSKKSDPVLESKEYICAGRIPLILDGHLLLALWGNKNWSPTMKVKKLKIFQNKRGLMGCKWSSLNAPSTENPLSHSLFLGLGEFPFPIIGPLG